MDKWDPSSLTVVVDAFTLSGWEWKIHSEIRGDQRKKIYPKGLFHTQICQFWDNDHTTSLTRAWPGGGVWRPPPLPNIRDSSKTNSAIDVKLGRPSHTTIWHRPWKFCSNPSEIFWDMVDFVTSLHAIFGRKLAKLRGSVEDAVLMKTQMKNTLRRKMRSSTRWLSRFFKILGF